MKTKNRNFTQNTNYKRIYDLSICQEGNCKPKKLTATTECGGWTKTIPILCAKSPNPTRRHY